MNEQLLKDLLDKMILLEETMSKVIKNHEEMILNNLTLTSELSRLMREHQELVYKRLKQLEKVKEE